MRVLDRPLLQTPAGGFGGSEAMSRVAEAALGEGKDFCWADREHERGPSIPSEAILADLVVPSSVPLLRPGFREPVELLCVEPDRDERRDVRPAVCADGRDPEELALADRLEMVDTGLTGGVRLAKLEQDVDERAGLKVLAVKPLVEQLEDREQLLLGR